MISTFRSKGCFLVCLFVCLFFVFDQFHMTFKKLLLTLICWNVSFTPAAFRSQSVCFDAHYVRGLRLVLTGISCCHCIAHTLYVSCYWRMYCFIFIQFFFYTFYAFHALNMNQNGRLSWFLKLGYVFAIEHFHMTSRRPCWCSKTMKRRPCWCFKPTTWESNSFLM